MSTDESITVNGFTDDNTNGIIQLDKTDVHSYLNGASEVVNPNGNVFNHPKIALLNVCGLLNGQCRPVSN